MRGSHAGRRAPIGLLLLLVLAPRAPAAALEAADPPSAAAVKQRWQGRLDGRHFSATVRLEMERNGMREERRIEVWRDDQNGNRERLMVRFEEPPELRGLSLLYLESEGRSNDYFLYQPALRRVRRVPETMAREDVYGVDLEYLGFGVAMIEPTQLEEVRAEPLDGRPAFYLRETALRENPRFDERRVWLDPETWIPIKIEHRRHGAVSLVATTQEVRAIQDVATPVRVRFERPGETVTMTVGKIEYQASIPEAFFSTLALLK
jgi:Outer membrane lipoprotein-sorting protein